MKRLEPLLFAAVAFAPGCARYHPLPLRPAASSTEFTSRGLDDSGLRRFLARYGSVREGPPAGSVWQPRDLALVALYYNAELDSARAVVGSARAAEITAGQRPLPSTVVNVGRAANADTKSSAWSSMLTTGFTFELGGKRRARLGVARARTLAAILGLENVAWRVALDAERAAIATAEAERNVVDARAERDALATLLGLLRARFTEGSISVADVARADGDVRSATLALMRAETIRLDARDSLARVLGVPITRGWAPVVVPDTIGGCAAIANSVGSRSVSHDSLQSLALRRRLDVGTALAEYVATEEAVKLEVADRYPDIVIAPGFGWNQGVAKWALGLTLPALAINRNVGLLAEAEARRASAASRFEHVQQLAIQDIGAARLECDGAREQLSAADSLVRNSRRQFDLAEAAYRRGETGRTEVAITRLSIVRALRAQQTALARISAAGVAIERAVGGWLAEPSLPFDDVLISPRSPPDTSH